MNRTSCALAAVSLLCGCAAVPHSLQPPTGERYLATWPATGHWVWHCRLSNDGQQLAWAMLRPDLVLRDPAGQEVARLQAGPNLVHRDGSVSELTLQARHDVPAALPWVLYSARSAGPAGALAAVGSVQQLHSRGGTMPTDGCTSGEQIMAERAVPFAAELRLFVR